MQEALRAIRGMGKTDWSRFVSVLSTCVMMAAIAHGRVVQGAAGALAIVGIAAAAEWLGRRCFPRLGGMKPARRGGRRGRTAIEQGVANQLELEAVC